MSAGGAEAVLIGLPGDGDGNAFRGGVRVRSALDVADILRFGSNKLLLAGRINPDAVLALEAL